MGAEYLFYVKSIATFAPTFYGYIISALASVKLHRVLEDYIQYDSLGFMGFFKDPIESLYKEAQLHKSCSEDSEVGGWQTVDNFFYFKFN